MANYEFLYRFTKDVLHIDKSVRWVAVTNDVGVLLVVELREGLAPLLSEEENEQYAAAAISRHKLRVDYQDKIGKLTYALGKYEKIFRVTVPITEKYYLFLTIDSDLQNVDSIVNQQIIPIIRQNIDKFQ